MHWPIGPEPHWTMVNYCRVLGCNNRPDRDRHLQFYRLPKVIRNQGEQCRRLSEERRRLWIAKLNQDLKGKNLDNIRICSAHFVSGKWNVDNSGSWLVFLCNYNNIIHIKLQHCGIIDCLLSNIDCQSLCYVIYQSKNNKKNELRKFLRLGWLYKL